MPNVLCHNDLVAANVLDDGNLVLVDFEYAVRAAPVLDLAGLAGMNDYGDRACRELLAAYNGDTRTPIAPAELSATVRMVRLIAYFWARMSERRVADATPYAALAADIEARLL
jgi:thiamine kinase-like enzyme